MKADSKITICTCVSRSFVCGEKVSTLAGALVDAGYDVALQPDLCQMLMQHTPAVDDIAQSAVLACYPRAVGALFQRHGLAPLQTLDIRNGDVSDVLSALGVPFPEREALPAKETVVKPMGASAPETGTDVWYPVIDKNRCTECRLCHDFCLFGVYDVENGTVVVKQPQNCKNNCPACARICPSRAVVFPKHGKSPINGGLEDEEPVAVDTKAVYADALRMRLQQRRASVPLKKDDK